MSYAFDEQDAIRLFAFTDNPDFSSTIVYDSPSRDGAKLSSGNLQRVRLSEEKR